MSAPVRSVFMQGGATTPNVGKRLALASFFHRIVMPDQGFSRKERLSKRKLIDELFLRGRSIVIHPLRVLWMSHPLDPDDPHQVLIAVSKRNFRSAVDRNKIKRRIREAYRLNKTLMAGKKRLAIGFVFTGRHMPPFKEISEKVVAAMTQLQSRSA